MTLIAASQLCAPTTGPRFEADQKGINSCQGNKHLLRAKHSVAKAALA
ncbi:hypothetical protein [Sphingopyxis sp.]|nr:hypothetical protein [Sphingopyxis sp.]